MFWSLLKENGIYIRVEGRFVSFGVAVDGYEPSLLAIFAVTAISIGVIVGIGSMISTARDFAEGMFDKLFWALMIWVILYFGLSIAWWFPKSDY